MIWTGRISYSLYLVHWPLIIYYNYWRFAPPTEFERIALVIGSFALAVPLNAFVENRFKRSRAPDRSSDAALPVDLRRGGNWHCRNRADRQA